MAEVYVSGGYWAIVSDEGLDLVAGYSWHAVKQMRAGTEKIYACTSLKGKTTYMHRMILNAPKGLQVDHKDNNGLNNQRDNIRLATVSQQAGNTRSKGGVSKYKGVYWHHQHNYPPERGLWAAVLSLPGGKTIKKYFHNEDDAARKYNEMALEHFGEFALLNEVI